VTDRTLVEELADLLTHFLWFEMDRLDLLATVTTPICHLSALGIECRFSFFPKGWDIDEIEVGGRHREIV
jgi:hypothetical protein